MPLPPVLVGILIEYLRDYPRSIPFEPPTPSSRRTATNWCPPSAPTCARPAPAHSNPSPSRLVCPCSFGDRPRASYPQSNGPVTLMVITVTGQPEASSWRLGMLSAARAGNPTKLGRAKESRRESGCSGAYRDAISSCATPGPMRLYESPSQSKRKKFSIWAAVLTTLCVLSQAC